jgi:O-antigen/teichoic acid export membrane protein
MTRSLFYSTIAAASSGLLLLLAAMSARALGRDVFGEFSLAISLATIAETFMDLGLHQITIRAIARNRNEAGRLFYTSLGLKVLPGVLMVALFTAITFRLRPEADVRLACVLLVGSAVMRSYLLTARGILQGLERFDHDALVTVLDRVVLVAACGIALWRGAGLVGVSVVFLLARASTTAAALILTRTHVQAPRFDRSLWRTLPAEALPVGAFLLVLNVYNRVDTVILNKMAGDIPTGIYGAAYPLYEGATYAAAILSSVIKPRLSRLWTEDRVRYRRLVARSMAGIAALAVIVTIVGWPLAGFAVQLVYGPGHAPEAAAFRLLLLGLPFIYVLWVLHGVAISAFHTRQLVLVTAVGTVVNVGLNLWLIPHYGANGASIATVLSEAAVMILLAWQIRSAIWPDVPVPDDDRRSPDQEPRHLGER